MLNSLSSLQLDYIRLWFLVQHSITSFYKIKQHYTHLAEATQPDQIETWQKLGIHKNHIQRLQDFHLPESQLQFQHCIALIQKHSDFILTFDHPDYPTQLLPYSNKPPILFGQGDAQALLQPQIAIVGSRKPSNHGRQVAYDFAYYLSEKGFYINSGLAQGIDEAAHQGALQHNHTIAVMGTGLDQTYPSQHQQLRQQILDHSGTIISEFLPGTSPLQQHFPRRNRIVSALSLGVIVAEAALKSGSLITAKWAAEQGKSIFAIPGHIYSEHHQGCHQLIREGAILVDHPEQVIEDLALPTQWQTQQHSEQAQKPTPLDAQPALPAHLSILYNQLDWMGQHLDELVIQQQLDIATLTSQLMELELLGLCTQQAGLYLRCRPGK
ncbi:DNA protecting protein DprA [Acinetobacter sp. ANC 4169]|uniref:DNA-processing protein DprA n=1 Tax=Acinetobacter sp. ANC 4169 TaxID=1977879 RepID=UPI000A32CACB|nr:DNA-processing protein DprA [Acinetobacter sp. ANC 4169]OTG70105.1 DNA protecting protein DprA [Acinetobacter sp. ANC 4169]